MLHCVVLVVAAAAAAAVCNHVIDYDACYDAEPIIAELNTNNYKDEGEQSEDVKPKLYNM
jgi:hypothetical protein